ncbi:M1 family metallopeptidase [Planococcus sp. YIM B11945]|uniref:M1 family metallopeptidase n=1 Tax=Planococcus sp. YIM B11945 TaxID=3435410 RepID=UPI003D7C6301
MRPIKKKWLWIGIGAVLLMGITAYYWFQANDGSAAGKLDPEASATYELDVTLDEANSFQINAKIEVLNESKESWDTIGFYFIPNAINEEAVPGLMQDSASTAISSVKEANDVAAYSLENNELLVELKEELLPGEKRLVDISYRLSLPEDGLRLSRKGNNFYLAQWYPMLGYYQNGWTIEDFDMKGESYHTGYSDFLVSYQLPRNYLVASSAEDGKIQENASGQVKGTAIKDFYLAFMDPAEWSTHSAKANDTVLRFFLPKDTEIMDETIETAQLAYAFFEKQIGDNPSSELDIIANDGNMEYPNAIEVASGRRNLEQVLVHEIAHQWFYYLVSNDPYTDAWLDESVTEYAASLFIADRYGDEKFGFESAALMSEAYKTNKFSNLPLDQYEEAEYYATIYGKTPLLLRDFFNERGGAQEAWLFFSAYYNQHQFHTVDSETFVAFMDAYYGEEVHGYFKKWLKI